MRRARQCTVHLDFQKILELFKKQRKLEGVHPSALQKIIKLEEFKSIKGEFMSLSYTAFNSIEGAAAAIN